ncbi:MAG: enoyl-CoA hydratase [Rhodospirillaceae bacterium]
MSTNEGSVHYESDGTIARVVFDRPAARNAMTWNMYEQLADACRRAASEPGLRLVTFRGAGGEAFIAGTDIAQFKSFESGDDGVAYEAKVEAYVAAVEAIPLPTLAIVEGVAVGGGVIIAAACDLRIATSNAVFGAPIARTLGNCLSIANHHRLIAAFGASRASRMLMLAENLTASEAVTAGFLLAAVPSEELDARVEEVCRQIVRNAPITTKVSKVQAQRLRKASLPEDSDLIRLTYGSRDFHEGVEAFVAKRKPQWEGR